MPRVSVWSRPTGLPIATTSSPTLAVAESPRRAGGRGSEASTRRSARSSTVSRPRTFAPTLAPLSSVTASEAAPSTTCAFVSTCPSRSMMTPEPTTFSKRRSGFDLLILVAWIATTDGETRS